MKKTKRKGFNFFRSYYDVFNELKTKKDKLQFIEALLDKQFLGVDPENLSGMAKFAWISQVNSIDNQVKGYEDKTKTKLTPTDGGANTPTEQVQVEEKGKVEVKEQLQQRGDLKINLENDFLIKISEFFSQSNQVLKERVCKTLNVFFELEKFEIFKSETLAYIEFKNLSGERIHAWESYLRDWEKTSWKQKLKNEKSKEKISPQKKSRIDEFIGS